jgi:hypothetical protein
VNEYDDRCLPNRECRVENGSIHDRDSMDMFGGRRPSSAARVRATMLYVGR